jgi:hypothetical protein
MIKFFRKIRYDLMEKNKTGKYLKYAIGEIVLVVIGILIALQINNLNEVSKQNQLREVYETRLITELKNELKALKEDDSILVVKREIQRDYIRYYKNPNKDINVLIQKIDSVKWEYIAPFNNGTNTIEDLMSTGNLSLFSPDKKEAILGLKEVQDYYKGNQNEVFEKLLISQMQFEQTADAVTFYETVSLEYEEIKDWRYNVNSEQYRLFNNRMHNLIRAHNFQIALNKIMRNSTENLLKLLEKE